MNAKTRDTLAIQFGNIASEAGRFIVAGFPTIHISRKTDGSPVSDADTGAENLIRAQLDVILPGVAVVGEETFDPAACKNLPQTFILIDPIDGTRDFVNGGDQYTVNIALIDSGRPIVACVYAPILNDLYLAGADARRADVKPGDLVPDDMQKITTGSYPTSGLRAITSRSHLDAESEALLKRLPIAQTTASGSSLKFCAVARGDADIYPRLGPTMEWDTAAGHAVLNAAGGSVLARDGAPLRYGKVEAGLRNDGFVAWGRNAM